MRRVLLLLALVAPVLAGAQNFPDIPEVHFWSAVPTRAQELMRVAFEQRLLSKSLYSNLEPYQVGMKLEFDITNHLRLASVYLGVDERALWRNELGHWLSNLSLAEALLAECWGGIEKIPKDMKETIATIRSRAAKHGYQIDERFRRFSDVPNGHWADDAIHNLRRAGIVTGFPDNTYRGG